ncbi:hypothetical protein [Thiohalorhabdus sp.]|uniref:hypothetical protein n=1 Tax=Thiohalorhabdus sp. TaxID=3094134 RepID=UPI002FC27A44
MGQTRRSLRYLIRIVVFLAILVAGAIWFIEPLERLYRANPPLNGVILLLLGVGLVDVLWQLGVLVREDRYLDRIAAHLGNVDAGREAPEDVDQAVLTGEPRGQAELLSTVRDVVLRGHHHTTLPYLLDSLGERTESRQTLPRYLAGTLIVLGLLGTFWGLLQTVQGVQGIIDTLAAEKYDDVAAFVTALRDRMAAPIDGMALAFATSLYGLGASLIVGFTENQLGRALAHGQSRTEELIVTGLLPFWRARRRPEDLDMEAEDRPAYTAALLEGVSQRLDAAGEQMERLIASQPEAGTLARTVESSGEATQTEIRELANHLERLEAQRNRALGEHLDRLARLVARDKGSDHGPSA